MDEEEQVGDAVTAIVWAVLGCSAAAILAGVSVAMGGAGWWAPLPTLLALWPAAVTLAAVVTPVGVLPALVRLGVSVATA